MYVLIIFILIFLVLERIIWVSIISYGEIWITSTFPERIMLANQGTTVISFLLHWHVIIEVTQIHVHIRVVYWNATGSIDSDKIIKA
jgi:hypothetical protein